MLLFPVFQVLNEADVNVGHRREDDGTEKGCHQTALGQGAVHQREYDGGSVEQGDYHQEADSNASFFIHKNTSFYRDLPRCMELIS